MDKYSQAPIKGVKETHPAFKVESMNDQLLDPIVRLMRTLANPIEQIVLGDALLDEIYFRLICNDTTGILSHILQHKGQVRQISKVVDHIHEGKNVNEAGYLVGYNSPAQFSREYKRYFGYSPSETQNVVL